MLKSLLYLLILLPFSLLGQQNLVPNPSFEIYDTCPYNTGQIHYAIPWFQSTQGTPDYLNSCVSYLGIPANFWGNQSAHTGNAYAGFFASLNDTSNFLNYREYVEVKLRTTVIGFNAGNAAEFADDAFFIGANAGLLNSGGDFNVFVGSNAGRNNVNVSGNVLQHAEMDK